MDKYIKADSLIELTRKTTTENSAEWFINMVINSVYVGDTLNIVRCKDCKYCEPAPKWKDFEFGCMLRREYTTETDFCSQAERKETNE